MGIGIGGNGGDGGDSLDDYIYEDEDMIYEDESGEMNVGLPLDGKTPYQPGNRTYIITFVIRYSHNTSKINYSTTMNNKS